MSTKHNSNNLQGFIPYAPSLGQGYSSDKDMAAEFPCFINGTVTESGGGSSIIHFGSSVSFSDIQNSLNVNVDAKVGIGPFSGSASASYSKFVEDDAYSFSLYYYEQVFMPTKSWGPASYGKELLNPFGTGVYNSGPETFRLVCGDKIYDQVHEGISLYATMRLKFSSSYDKSTFEANASASFGDIVSASASVQKTISSFSLTGEVEISAYQIGGDPSQLPKIFNKSGSGDYYVLSCSFADFSSCQKTAAGVLDYAQGNLPNQTQSASPIFWGKSDVSDLGIDTGTSVITSEIEEARTKLGGIYQNMTFASSVASHVTSSQYAEYFPDLVEFKESLANSTINLSILQDGSTGAVACYTQPLTCNTTAATIESSLSFVNVSMLEKFYNLNGYKLTNHLSEKICSPPLPCQTINGEINSILVPLDFEGSFINIYFDNKMQLPNVGVMVKQESQSIGVDWGGCEIPTIKQTSVHPLEYNFPYNDNSECMHTFKWADGCGSSNLGTTTCTGNIEFDVTDNPI